MNVNANLFHGLLVIIPPTVNMVGGKNVRRLKEQITDWLNELYDAKRFSEGDKLFGRILYFNHEKKAIRDIHNIIKPLFDLLEEKVIHDDKQIYHFEGLRLDMEYSNSWFEMEYNSLSTAELQKILTQTCCLIQISKLPTAT